MIWLGLFIAVIVLILLLVGAFPTWGWSRGYGYGPSGIVGTIAMAAGHLVMFLMMNFL